MKRQIRRGVFETNSSSTHSLTMMMKSDYERWASENLYLFKGPNWSWDLNKPVINTFYTREEAVEFVKNNKYYDSSYEIDDEYLKEEGFISFNDEGSEYLESFYEEFTTPLGETIVAFGEYGFEG